MSPKRSAWSNLTYPCLNSSSRARKRTITSSRSTGRSSIGQADPAGAGSSSRQLLHGVGDAGTHRARRGTGRSAGGSGLGRRRPEVRRAEPLRRHAVEQVGNEIGEALVGPLSRGNDRSAGVREPAEHLRDVLERLALEQAGEEQVALLPERELLVQVDAVAAGKETTGLQLDQRRRDQQELVATSRSSSCSRSISTR
jgi:hypothetical protein